MTMTLGGDSGMAILNEKRWLVRVAVWSISFVLFFTGLLLITEVWAATFYVSDTTLETILRSGPGIHNRIIASLQVGARVTVIKEEDGWAQVALEDGRTGWTPRRYLSDRPPWRITAEKLEAENQGIRKRISDIDRTNKELLEENRKLEKQLRIDAAELESVRQQYETLKKGAANYLGLKNAFEKLKSEVPQVESKLGELQRAHDKLKSSNKMRWFLYGAGAIIVGWLVGLMMGGRRRRSSEIYR